MFFNQISLFIKPTFDGKALMRKFPVEYFRSGKMFQSQNLGLLIKTLPPAKSLFQITMEHLFQIF